MQLWDVKTLTTTTGYRLNVFRLAGALTLWSNDGFAVENDVPVTPALHRQASACAAVPWRRTDRKPT